MFVLRFFPESRATVERALERDPPRQQQHPLDYIEEQVKIQEEKKLQIQLAAFANPQHTSPAPATHPQAVHTHPVEDHYEAPSRHPVHIPRDIPVEHVPRDLQSSDGRDGHHEVRDPRERGTEPRDRISDPRERLSENRDHLNESREHVRDIPETRERLPEGCDQPQEVRDFREQRDYREFPPEPKEPYRESYDDQHVRDHTDKDYHKEGRMRRNSRDSDSRDPRDYGSSRDSSRDSRDYNKEREYRDREHDRERYRERDKSWEFDREREARELPRSPRPRSPPKCRTPPRSRTPEKSPIKPKSPPRTRSPVKEIIEKNIETGLHLFFNSDDYISVKQNCINPALLCFLYCVNLFNKFV